MADTKRKRTDAETVSALRAMQAEEALEDVRATSDDEVARAIAEEGGDAAAIGERGRALADKMLVRRERLAPWQEGARARLERVWTEARKAPKTPRGLPRAELLARIDAARRDARFAAPLVAAFRSRGPEAATDEELAALLDEIEILAGTKDGDE